MLIQAYGAYSAKSNRSEDKEHVMASYPPNSGWLVVEAMSDERTIVFEGSRARPYASLARRKIGATLNTAALNDFVNEVVEAGSDVQQVRHFGDVAVVAVPVMGPASDYEVYGVCIWVGADSSALPEQPRTVGTMLWDPETQGTLHSPIADGDILGYDPPVEHRVSTEVFKHYHHYPNEHLLGPWVRSVMEGHTPQNDTFDDELDIVRTNDELRRVYLTMRAVEQDGRNIIRGLIHDISDVTPPSGWRGFDRQTARTSFKLVAGEDSDHGYGHVNFATGIILEWFITPPGPLSVWETQNVNWTDENSYLKYLDKAMRGAEVEFSTTVSFDAGERFPIRVKINPSNSGEDGNGVLIVSLATPPDGDDGSLLAF